MNPVLLDLPDQIFTPQLCLRGPRPGDGKELNAAILESISELKPWLPFARSTPTTDESEENVRRAHAKFCLREDLRFHFYDRSSGKMLGSSGLHRIQWSLPSFEIGYWVRTEYQGKGYVSEAVNALTRFAFEYLQAKRVEIRCNARNVRSLAVMKRLGFNYEALLKMSDAHALSIEDRDTLVYARFTADGLPALEVQW